MPLLTDDSVPPAPTLAAPSTEREPSRSRTIRTLFVSDVHLGTRHARADLLADFLSQHQPEQLYLVGDFIDGWKLQRRWRWDLACGAVIDRIVAMGASCTDVYYTPGNHDDFLRTEAYLHRALRHFDFLRVRDEFVHELADGRRFLVVHGDQFDKFETEAQWVSRMAAVGYDALLSTNRLVSRTLTGRQHYGFSAFVKGSVKSVVRFLSEFETRLMERAEELECDGAVCGHVHTPTISQHDGLTYCNTGDWVEHCSALVEYGDGTLELVHWNEQGRVPLDVPLVSPSRSSLPATRDDRLFRPLDEMRTPIAAALK